jgi:hypothetical protein
MIPKPVRADAAEAAVSFGVREPVRPGTQVGSDDMSLGRPISVQTDGALRVAR